MTPTFTAALIVSGDTVLQAGPVLSWTVGERFIMVRNHCKAKGWQIQPLIQDNPPAWFELDNIAYELHWHEGNITRITEHKRDGECRDLRYSELPDILKNLL